MSDNYPPGVSASTPNAPWNDPEPPKCDGCGNRIVRETDHDVFCSYSNMGPGETRLKMEENAKIEKAERQLDERRLEKAMSQ